jgi:hypothetical protein
MRLATRRRGYGIMNKEMTGISFDGDTIGELKAYCYGSDVIAERIPKVCGFSINVYWYKNYDSFFDFKYDLKNIGRLHWRFEKQYMHVTGKVVYKNK